MRRTIATMATILAVAGTSSFIVVQSKEEPAKIANSQLDRSDIKVSRNETRQSIDDIKQLANDKLANQKAAAEKRAADEKRRAQKERARKIAEQQRLALAAEKAREQREVNSKPRVYKPKVNHVAPGGIAACIRKYESGGNYTAQNPSSTASGAYQFLDSTWQAVTGLPGRAMNYSPSQQDAAFWKLWNNGRGASQWVTAGMCGY